MKKPKIVEKNVEIGNQRNQNPQKPKKMFRKKNKKHES